MIQHSCGVDPGGAGLLGGIGNSIQTHAQKTSGSSSDSSASNWPWWAWLLLALLALCCCIAFIGGLLFVLGMCEHKPKKKKRAVKRVVAATPAPEPVAEVAQIPQQPVYMIQQQVPVPTTISQVPTYQPVQYAAAPPVLTAQPAVEQQLFQPMTLQQPALQQQVLYQQPSLMPGTQ